MIEGIRSHLVLRLARYYWCGLSPTAEQQFDLEQWAGITDTVFRIRNAGVGQQ